MDGTEAIAEFGVWYVVFLFTLTLHEGAHGLAAWLGGDPTAYHEGQVSLNPWPHMQREMVGTILVPIVTFIMSGWMMGWASTPYDPLWARRHPRRHAAMSAAGPVANFILAGAAFLALRVLLGTGLLVPPDRFGFGRLAIAAPGTPPGSMLHAAAYGLSVTLSLNVLLGVFNLIPLPPLDGSGILQGLLPELLGRPLEALRANPMMSLLGLLVAWRVADFVLAPAFRKVVLMLYEGHL